MKLALATEYYRDSGRGGPFRLNLDQKALDLDTDEKLLLYLKRVDTRRSGWWGVVSKKFEPLYEAESRAVVRAIKNVSNARMAAVAEKAIESLRSEWEKVMVATLLVVVEDFGSDVADDLGAKIGADGAEEWKWEFDPTSAAIQEWVKTNGGADITSILATNIVGVQKVIGVGLADNLGTPKIAMNLRKFYADGNKYKAMRVARTEVAKASTFGSLSAAKQSGFVKSKSWITAGDDRVRDAHIAMNGEMVSLDDTFSNGLEGPGEPNCRCAIAFTTKEAADVRITDFGTDQTASSFDVSHYTAAQQRALPKYLDDAKAWKKALAGKEKLAVRSWLQHGYTDMRQLQAGKFAGSSSARLEVLDRTASFNSAIAKAPTYRGSVFRGMQDLDLATMKQLANAKTLTLDAHTSFTAVPNVGASFATRSYEKTINSVMLSVKQSRTGKLLGNHAVTKKEYEVVMQRGVKFNVVSRNVERVPKGFLFEGSDEYNLLHLVLEEVK